MNKSYSLWNKFWKDSKGHVVIFQWPNTILWCWIVFTLLTKVFTDGSANRIFETLAFGSLFVWGWLELTDGVNYFRRILGLIMLIIIVRSHVG